MSYFNNLDEIKSNLNSSKISNKKAYDMDYDLSKGVNFQTPAFNFPRMPILVKVPEPLSYSKPPPPGYDMKTLRKQVEYFTKVCY